MLFLYCPYLRPPCQVLIRFAYVLDIPVLIEISCLYSGQKRKGSGTLLVRLYKDAGTPANECSLSEFLICYKCYLDIGTLPIESVPHP